MKWQKITESNPPNKSDCIVLRKSGDVVRAERNRAWGGGFRNANGSPRNPGGSSVEDAVRFILFREVEK